MSAYAMPSSWEILRQDHLRWKIELEVLGRRIVRLYESQRRFEVWLQAYRRQEANGVRVLYAGKHLLR